MGSAGPTDLSWEAFQAARTRAFSRMNATTAMLALARSIARSAGTESSRVRSSGWSDVATHLPAVDAQDVNTPYLDYASQLVEPDDPTAGSGEVGQLSVGCDDPATLVAAITWGPPRHTTRDVDLAQGQPSVSQVASAPSARLRAWSTYADYSNDE